jgi:hypothetical protein
LIRLNGPHERGDRHRQGRAAGRAALERRRCDYKRLLLRSLRHFDGALRWDSRGIRRFMRGRRGAARTARRRAAGHFERSSRLERRAVRAIEG